MSEEPPFGSDRKVKITIEITGPKDVESMKKILAELKRLGKSEGFDVERPPKAPRA